MAKKIKFPLILKNDAQVRTLEELQDNFEFDKLYDYFVSGKLLTWLNDRYYEDESEQISCLTGEEVDFQKRIHDIFGVPFVEENQSDLETKKRNREKYEKVKLYTDDEEILSNLDAIAMNQEELADLLDDNVENIYLFEGTYKIPLSRGGISYCGIGVVTVQISSRVNVDLKALGIYFRNVTMSCKDEIEIRISEDDSVECVGRAKYLSHKKITPMEFSIECVTTYGRQEDDGYFISVEPMINSERSRGPGAVALISTNKSTGEKDTISLLTYITPCSITRGNVTTEEYCLPTCVNSNASAIEAEGLLKYCNKMIFQKDNKVFFIKNCLSGTEDELKQKEDYDISELYVASNNGEQPTKIIDNNIVLSYIKNSIGYTSRDMRDWSSLVFSEIIALTENSIIVKAHISGWCHVGDNFMISVNTDNKAITLLSKARYHEINILHIDDQKIIYGGGDTKSIFLYNYVEKYTVNLADDIECHSLGDTTEYPITVRNNQLYYIKRVPGSVSYVSVLFKVSLEDYTVLKIKELSSFAPKGTYKYHRASFEWKDDSLYIICPYGYAMSKDGEEKFQII